MSIAATNLAAGNLSSPSGSLTTSSFTPSANSLVSLLIATDGYATPNVSPSNGNGLTWVQLYDPAFYGCGTNQRFGAWRAMASTPSSGTISISMDSNVSYVAYHIVEFTGVDTSGSNGSGAIVQTNVVFSNSGTLNANLSLTNASNAILGYCISRDGSTMTVGSGFTSLRYETAGSPSLLALTQWLNGVSQTACDFTFNGIAAEAFSWEIKASGGSVPTTGAPSGLVVGAGF